MTAGGISRRGLFAGMGGTAAILGLGKLLPPAAPAVAAVAPAAPVALEAPWIAVQARGLERVIATAEIGPQARELLADWFESRESRRARVALPGFYPHVLDGDFHLVELRARGHSIGGPQQLKARFEVTSPTLTIGGPHPEFDPFGIGRWRSIEVVREDPRFVPWLTG